MNFSNQVEWNNRFLVTGQSGTGKSWLRDWIILQYLKNDKRRYFMVIDDRLSNAKRLYKKGFKVQKINNLNHLRKIKSFIKYHEKVYFILEMDREDSNYFIDYIIEIMYQLKDTFFITDESHLFYKRYKEPGGIEKLLRNGRKDGIDQMYVTQRLVDLSPDIVDLCNRKISFRITGKNSVQRISEFYDKFDGRYNKLDYDLIDNNVSGKYKKELEKLIDKYKRPELFISNLENRCFIYSKEDTGQQELCTSNILSI